MTQIIRPMQAHDVAQVVKVHEESFNGFFLTALGSHFLNELYTGILVDPSGIAFVCVDGHGLLGFVAGSDESKGLYSRLLRRRWWRFGLASIRPVMRTPSIFPRLIRALHKPKEALVVDHAGLLMSIAVSPHAQGLSIGSKLVDAFLTECRRRKLNTVCLTTDKENNEQVNAFYRHKGFSLLGSYQTEEGRWMNEYAIQAKDFATNGGKS